MKKKVLAAPAESSIRRVLKKVDDPDVRINIVDLGLIYGVTIKGKKIQITMTFTSIGCPQAPEILYRIEAVLQDAFPRYKTAIEVVWEPAWNKEMISEEIRSQLMR